MDVVNRWAIYTYTLPLKRPILARGENRRQRKGLLLFLKTKERIGIGEAAPIDGFHTHTLQQVQTELIAYCTHRQTAKREDLSALSRFALEMTEQTPSSPQSIAPVESQCTSVGPGRSFPSPGLISKSLVHMNVLV